MLQVQPKIEFNDISSFIWQAAGVDTLHCDRHPGRIYSDHPWIPGIPQHHIKVVVMAMSDVLSVHSNQLPNVAVLGTRETTEARDLVLRCCKDDCIFWQRFVTRVEI